MPIAIDNLGIPPLAGICTYEEAGKVGLDIERSVRLLKRYNYVKTQLNRIYAAHLAKTPEWEVKCAFSLHLWLEAEHAAAIRKRISEMREPPLQLDKVPDAALKVLFDELIRAEDTVELLAGIYDVLKPELIRSLAGHLAETNPLADYVTCRLLKTIIAEEEEMVRWGSQALDALLQREPSAAERAGRWQGHIRRYIELAGGISGEEQFEARARSDVQEAEPFSASGLAVRSDGSPYIMDATPRRDDRFVDPFNQAARIDDYFREERRSKEERVCALLFKRVREMDIPEWMGPILYKTTGKSFDYYHDMSRQLWDEARHAMMGEVGLNALGIPFYRYPISTVISTMINEYFSPLEAHTILWGIEQGLMKKETGKPLEWAIARSSDMPLAATFHDFDWADEVLHAQIGRKWLLPEYKDMDEMTGRVKALYAKWDRLQAQLAHRSGQIDWWPEFAAELERLAAKGR